MEFGRILYFGIANKGGRVLYERWYDSFSELEKSQIRVALDQTSEPFLAEAKDSLEYFGKYKSGTIVFIPTGDIVLYALGHGEYDELALTEVLRAILGALKASTNPKVKKPPTEADILANYGKVALLVDEAINEGIAETLDTPAILEGMKMKAPIGI